MKTADKPAILLVCTGNSCRSQMAEGLVKHSFGESVKVYSAGSHPAGVVHPMAIEVMKESGINIRRNKSQHWDELPVQRYDLIITLCDHAEQYCPLVPAANGDRLYIPFPDPIRVTGSKQIIKQAFRESREQIAETLLPVIEEWLENRNSSAS